MINAAETMTSGDSEYLMHVGNNSLVLTRAGIIAKMQELRTTPKELADLTMALSRVEAILAKHTDELDPDDEDAGHTLNESSPAKAELDRLARIVERSAP